MESLLGYVGVAIVVLAVGFALLQLSRKGILPVRLKHGSTEVELAGADRSGVPPSAAVAAPRAWHTPRSGDINLLPEASADCGELGIPVDQVKAFIVQMASSHPGMFGAAFSAIPVVFREMVALVSWDGSTVLVERIIGRGDAYPLSDIWTTCVGLYRRATLLSYRMDPNRLLDHGDANRTFKLFQSLAQALETLRRKSREVGGEAPNGTQDLSSLLLEAQEALENGDVGTSVSRLEVLLGTAHRCVLDCSPVRSAGQRSTAVVASEKCVAPVHSERTAVLLVDDDAMAVTPIVDALASNGCDVVVATSTQEALRRLVERDFDAVLLDVMLPEIDGRELARIVRLSGSRARIVVHSAYHRTAVQGGAGTERFPCDVFLTKPAQLSAITAAILAGGRETSSLTRVP